MDIFKVVETLQSLSGDPVFAEAASLLVEQGERIADLENELATVNGGWIPVSLGFTPEPFVSVQGYMTDAGDFPPVRECYRVDTGHYYFPALGEFHPISHWMPMAEPPEAVKH
jgi:hypothetical protein